MELIDTSSIPYPRDGVTGRPVEVTEEVISKIMTESLAVGVVHCSIIGNINPLFFRGGEKAISVDEISRNISSEGGIDVFESKRMITFTDSRDNNIGNFLSTARVADMGKYFQLTTETYKL